MLGVMPVFADPQSVTVNAVAQSLPRVDEGDESATYQKDDETYGLLISHTTTKNGRRRHQVRLDNNKIATDPFTPANSRKVSLSGYFVIDEPEDGAYSNAEILLHMKGLIAWSSDANVTKVIAGES